MTVRVSIAQLKARLSEFLGVVREGEDVVVTDRGKPVARLTRVTSDEAMEARVEELVRAGLARRPTRPLDEEFFRLPRLPVHLAGLMVQALLDEREEGL
jgi:prevent-host-death family protein